MTDGKYARMERERRFLLPARPDPGAVTATRRVTDRYLAGTRLRLREMVHLETGEAVYKLTQKVTEGPGRELTTTCYLSPDEYRVLAALPGAVLVKTRYSVPPLGIDVFDAPLAPLVLAEAEFDSDAEAAAFRPPAAAVAEVTADPRFAGGRLAATTPAELHGWLAEYGLTVPRDLPL
jgi:CYTH domain-containing protein